MRVTQIQTNLYSGLNNPIQKTHTSQIKDSAQNRASNYASLPVSYKYGANIHFGEYFDPNRTVPHIDYEEYCDMRPTAKGLIRHKYRNFAKKANVAELFDPKDPRMPLMEESTMEEFLKTAQIYSKYKDQPIICLGRSPKWFLNANLWMEGGINDYKFIAFSGYWYRPDPREGIVKIKSREKVNGEVVVKTMGPTEKEEIAYRKYLKNQKADPQSIVDHMKKTGKKTVITDYICTGKGCTSFLDVLSHYAEDLGILEDFSKSIQIVGIGSMDYMEDLNPYAEEYSEPRVLMPERLIPYDRNIKQEYYNMDYKMFREMLLNQNTNECRSTYYPHTMWTLYNPERFKTGMIKDPKRVKEMMRMSKGPKPVMSHFTPAMFDFRNLLNFRILESIDKRGLLKKVHHSRF